MERFTAVTWLFIRAFGQPPQSLRRAARAG